MFCHPHRRALTALVLLAAFWALAPVAFPAETIAVRALVEKTDPAVGEPFILQVQVQGSDKVKLEDLSPLKDFAPVAAGGGDTNRSFYSNINGRETRNVFRGYLLNYKLTATKSGLQVIPALTVLVDGKPHQTNAIRLNCGAAPVNDNIRLRITVPRTTIYKGETIPVKIVLSLNGVRGIQQPDMTAPLLARPEFRFETPEEFANPQPGRTVWQLPINNETATGYAEKVDENGKEWTTWSTIRYLTPVSTGVFDLPPVTISGLMVTGEEDPLDIDSFFSRKAPKKFFATSEPVRLTVLELPAVGKPADFSGLVGKCSIAAKIEPEEAAVGEPLTLTVMLTGPEALKNVALPDLSRMPELARAFRIPEEQADGKVIGGVKVFTQTLRARSADVGQVPPLKLSYFNPETNRYEVAESRALPLKIHDARSVTARDIEGLAAPAAEGVAVSTLQSGIFHNYVDDGCLACEPNATRSWFLTPGWITLLAAPPLLWLLVVTVQCANRYREANHPARRRQTALRDFLRATARLAGAPAGGAELLQALREYFCRKLDLSAKAPCYAEIEPLLQARNIDRPTLENLTKIFQYCEASQYAGGAVNSSISEQFLTSTRTVVEQLDSRL